MTESSTAKAGIRKQMLTLREEAAARDPDAGEKLADIFPMRLLDRYGPNVAGYSPIRHEIDPIPLLNRMSKRGAKLSLPAIETNGEMVFRKWHPGEPLHKGPFGTKQPSPGAEEVNPGLVLVPLLAFDAKGNRIGYGGGNYDRALGALRAKGPAFACAVAYHAQMQENLPVEAHDQPLDWAITERGSLPLFMMRAAG